MSIKPAWLLVVASVAMLAACALGQNPIASAFNIAVEADADQLHGGNSQAVFADSQSGTLNPYSHSLSITDTETGGGYVTTRSSASASWINSASGVVAFRDMGWTRNSPLNHEAKLNNFFFGTNVWSYTFQATSNGAFSMNYNVWASGNTFGLLGVLIHWSGPGGDLDLQDPYNPTASGVFTRSVSSGTTYTVGIHNRGNVFSAAGQGFSQGAMSADFNWSIGVVPEPATVLTILIGGIGLLLRRKR